MNYNDYLNTHEWQKRSEIAKQKAGYRCQVCNSPDKLQAHHRTYERLGNELEEDITVLCDTCHELFSGKNKRTGLFIQLPGYKPLTFEQWASKYAHD